jgi:hypothetical protein
LFRIPSSCFRIRSAFICVICGLHSLFRGPALAHRATNHSAPKV